MNPPPASAAKARADASQHVHPKTDIEIAQGARMRPVVEIAREKLGIAAENLEPYGHYKAKVSLDYIKRLQDRPNGKLILVSAITPTPAGEGKTTTTVGLTDALNHIGKKAMLCIREPSLGPCFGDQGRGGRRRLRAGRADGGDQSALHRRSARYRHGKQSARGADRQSHLLGECARHRCAPDRLAARHRHERAGAALDRILARRHRQRISRARTASTSPSRPR